MIDYMQIIPPQGPSCIAFYTTLCLSLCKSLSLSLYPSLCRRKLVLSTKQQQQENIYISGLRIRTVLFSTDPIPAFKIKMSDQDTT